MIKDSGPHADKHLRERLRRLLRRRTPQKLPLGATTAAAVLIPLFEVDGEPRLWLLRRPTSMRNHAGQVALPGGKSDSSDESLLATALREADEELGIRSEDVDVLGALDDALTVTGFTITPWIGWLRDGSQVRPNPAEVARAFAPPLRTFFDPPSGVMPWRGWTVDGELVWGITAAILAEFVALLRVLEGERDD